MDYITNIDALSKALIGVMTLGALVFSFFRWVRPKMKQAASDIRAGRDALVGRDAIYDSTVPGKILVPALPGIGVRMASTENNLTELTTAVAKLADNDQRTTDLEHWRAEVDRWRIAVDEGVVERVVTRAESTAAWRAVEAIAAQPAEHDAPLPGLGEN
jgi:hypothetical protein